MDSKSQTMSLQTHHKNTFFKTTFQQHNKELEERVKTLIIVKQFLCSSKVNEGKKTLLDKIFHLFEMQKEATTTLHDENFVSNKSGVIFQHHIRHKEHT